MKILLVANYPLEYNPSMHAYGQLLFNELSSAGLEVTLLKPFPIFGRIVKNGSIGKWLGYFDRFLIFPIILTLYSYKFDLIHVVDHCNAVYAFFVRANKCVITCHDLIGIKASFGVVAFTHVSFTGKILQRLILKGLLRTKYIICVSEQTRQELLPYINERKHKIFTIHNALRLNTQNLRDATCVNRVSCIVSTLKPYILHVGSNMPQKNRAGVIEFFRTITALPRFRNFNLVFCGQKLSDNLAEQVRVCGLSRVVCDLGFVSDAELSYLYFNAEFLIFPSLMEGFGWPIIEAQSLGCLVVTSDIKPMNEVSGRGAILINPYNMSASAHTVADQYTRRDEIIELGYANSRKYMPEQMIDAVIEVYEEITFGQQKTTND
ncbi:glycosyltransferase family 4 protein [Acidithiobacillus caldus]|nr:glycosyltransferase family 1 protein [Acidithiobacillus caldus]